MKELVSIIMSTYNEELNWIEESINSILKQTYTNYEFIIILDNPNNTALKSLLEEYSNKDSRIQLIINDENKGLVKSLNIALKYCNGKYIARMDADDISLLNRLEIEKNYLEVNGLDFVFSAMMLIDEMGNYIKETSNCELDYKGVKKLLEISNISNHSTWFCKQEIFKTMNGYRNIPYCEDYDFSLRCLSYGYKIGKVNQPILKYRVRANSLSRSYSLEQLLNSRAILKLYKEGKLDKLTKVVKVLNRNNKEATDLEKKRYSNAQKSILDGIQYIKTNRIFKGVGAILWSFVHSKYIKLKYFNIIRCKIKQNLIKVN